MEKRFFAYPAVYVALVQSDQVFLLKRANTGYKDGYWNLPSGHIEAGEMPEDAVIREAKEEAGVDIARDNLKFNAALYRIGVGGRERTYCDYLFSATSWTGSPYNAEVSKCSEAGWFKLNDIPQPTTEGSLRSISMLLKGEVFGTMIEPEI